MFKCVQIMCAKKLRKRDGVLFSTSSPDIWTCFNDSYTGALSGKCPTDLTLISASFFYLNAAYSTHPGAHGGAEDRAADRSTHKLLHTISHVAGEARVTAERQAAYTVEQHTRTRTGFLADSGSIVEVKQDHQALLKAKYCPRAAAVSRTHKNTKKPM